MKLSAAEEERWRRASSLMLSEGEGGGEWLLLLVVVVVSGEEGSNVEEVHDTAMEARRLLFLLLMGLALGMRVGNEGFNREDSILFFFF